MCGSIPVCALAGPNMLEQNLDKTYCPDFRKISSGSPYVYLFVQTVQFSGNPLILSHATARPLDSTPHNLSPKHGSLLHITDLI